MTTTKTSKSNKRNVAVKRSAALKKDVMSQVEHLRHETSEISRLYVANLQRDMVQLIDALRHVGGNRVPAVLAELKDVIGHINLKPEKGRRKDLRKIEQAIRKMTKIVSAPEKAGA